MLVYVCIYIRIYIHTGSSCASFRPRIYIHYVRMCMCEYVCIECIYIHTYARFPRFFPLMYIYTLYTYVYMFVYRHIYVCMYMHTYARFPRFFLCAMFMHHKFMRVFVYAYIHLYVSIYIHVYVCIYVHTYTCTYRNMYVCMYININIYVCMHKYIYIYIYAHRHMNTKEGGYLYTSHDAYVYMQKNIRIHE